MATNSDLRKALLEKLGVTQQALSLRVQKKIRQLPMSTSEATYVIAHDEGLRLDSYLPKDEVATVRHLQAQLRQVTGAAPAPPRVNGGSRRAPKAPGPRQIRVGGKVNVKGTLLSSTTIAEAQEMASIYPMLYVLENSMREVVKRVMTAKFGADWWNTELTSGKLKSVHNTAAGRMTKESRQRWHQRRGDHPLYYIGLDELGDIINGKHEVFFPNVLAAEIDWFRQFMRELEPSRNVLCHMNPLSSTNATDVALKLERWEQLVAGSTLPT
jgi:hypothetical protein